MALFLNESLEPKYNLGSLDINYLESLKESNILHEKYFGKDSALLKVESLFDEVIKNTDKGLAITSNKNQKIISEISDILEKKFNFTKLHLIVRNGMINAYTVPLVSQVFAGVKNSVFSKPPFEINKNGYSFTNPAPVSFITITSDLFQSVKLNAEEVTAIILHEVGHNFFIHDALRSIMFAIFLPIFLLGVVSFYIKDVIIAILCRILDIISESLMKGVEVITTIITEIQLFFNKISKVFGIFSHLPVMVTLIPVRFVHFFSHIIVSNTYRQEQFSDEFATLYGYGKGLSSSMSKFDETLNNFKSSRDRTLFSTYKNDSEANEVYSFLYSLSNSLVHVFDVHPTVHTRLSNIANHTKKYADESKDPAIKNLLNKELELLNREVIKNEKYSNDSYFEKGKNTGSIDSFKEVITKISDYLNLDLNGDPRGSTDILDKVGVKV